MLARRLSAIACSAVLATCLVACADDVPSPSTPTAHTSTGTSSPPPLSDGGEPMERDFGQDTGGAAPVWDDASRNEAQALAQDVMTAYARPDLAQEQWWAEFSPHLSAQAAYDYQWVDPAAIPAKAVTGPATITAEPSVYLAELTVSTDAGTYGVLLSRTDGPSAWKVERITPPESLEEPAPGAPA
jgi:hypothetical protein